MGTVITVAAIIAVVGAAGTGIAVYRKRRK